MSFPRYPAYKDSGINLLGEIPEDWRSIRIKFLLRDGYEGLKIGPFGSQLTSEMLVSNAPFKVYGQENVIADDFERGERRIDEAKFDELSVYEIKAGDVLITMMGTSGRCAVVPEEIQRGVMDSHLLRMRLSSFASPKFLRVLIDESDYVKNQIRLLGKGSIMHGLNSSIVKDLFVAIPSPEDQECILHFLDREKAKIDVLIDEQEKLIALLKEKRQAVISHAVTKGLDPSVPMKDSGIEWLGSIPEHWERIQLGRVCKQVSDGPHFSPDYVDDGVMFLSARNISVDGWHLEDAKFVSEEDYAEFCKRVVPEKGDVLYTKGGTTGVARVVDLNERFQVWVHVAVLKLHLNVANPYFLAYALNSAGCYEQSQLHTRGATNQDLGLTRMIKIWLALPPISEQLEIVQFLNDEIEKIDVLTSETEKAICLLKERGTSLISAAVTGKIDVRQLAAAEAA